MSASSFDWFSGCASVAAGCPPALLAPQGFGQFFAAPNRAELGNVVPRILMHECLHAIQLAGSRWLQRMVAEDWRRVLAFEATGKAPAKGPLGTAWGRPPPGYPFAVRDLVELLARYWDIHIRSPRRVIAEQDALERGEQVAPGEADASAGNYDSGDYETAIARAAKGDRYVQPYLALKRAALDSPALRGLGPPDPVRDANRASWLVNVVLPIAGFVALNTDDPVRAFIAAIDAIFTEPDPRLATSVCAVDGFQSITLDALHHWPWLVKRMADACHAGGTPVAASPTGLSNDTGWTEHPVWRFHAGRCDAIKAGLIREVTDPDNEAAEAARRGGAATLELLAQTLRQNAFVAYALLGLPVLRAHLGWAFAPPLVRFDDANLPATSAAAIRAPWPIDAAALTRAVDEVRARRKPLALADDLVRRGLPPDTYGPLRPALLEP
jgi:hypothetical protein